MSDYTSDEEEPAPKPKKQRKLKLLGNISLISSDEDEKTNKSKKISCKDKTRKTKKLPKVSPVKSMIDLLTSEEEDHVPSKTIGKRKKTIAIHAEISDDNDSDHCPPPPKKTRVTVPKAKAKVPSLKKNTSATNKTSTKKNYDFSVEIKTQWVESELLAQRCSIDAEVAQNIVKLLEEGNTIPFIARYRKNLTKNMSPDEIREVKENFDDICKLKEKICTVAKVIKQAGKLNEQLQGKISSVRTAEELDLIFEPFKPENKGTLASRAKKLGLGEAALKILNNTEQIHLEKLVKKSTVGLKTIEDIQNGLVYIISAEIAIDAEVLNYVRELKRNTRFFMKTVERKTNSSKSNTTENAQTDNEKYEIYFNKSYRIDNLQSYQVLAINRGEAQKALTVKVDIPKFFNNKYRNFCNKKLQLFGSLPNSRLKILNLAVEDSLTRHIQPLVIRQIRTELTRNAHRQSTDIFATNLKHLLMAPPWKGKHILGMDPGFTNGVKLALISPTGKFLESNVIYPHTYHGNKVNNDAILRQMILKYNSDTIGIGNGHACRQTEEWVSGLIEKRLFGNLDVKYTIVNEDGASIYSCSAEARKEFGDLDPNIISAVSIARRLQDPLAELVKVEPNHLGIGMYQLDIKKKELEESLNGVVSECVSFVGVDLNTASQCLLKRVAGLSDKKANLVISYRETHGPFTHRGQLLKVQSVGEKSFQQCAGFLRISPFDLNDKSFYTKPNTTKLDSTIIHPESYSIARQIILQAGLKEEHIGTEAFMNTLNLKKPSLDVSKLVKELKTNKETVHLIFDALSRKCDYDMRMEGNNKGPLFNKNITELSSLTEGMILTGQVTNVVQFGAFVDVGVGSSGLIHTSKMNNLNLNIGDKVETKVLSVDLSNGRKKLSLEAVSKL